jgi:hypothetical protein
VQKEQAMASASPSPGAIVAGPVLTGSLGAAARQHGGSLARAWLGVKAVLVCDTSGSMAAQDAGLKRSNGEVRDRRSRWDACCEELARLQVQHPGKTAIVAFSDQPTLALGGRLPPPQSSTDLAAALDYVHSLLEPDASGITVIVLSDGEPNDEAEALTAGRKLVRLGAKLEAVYIGPEGQGGILATALAPLLAEHTSEATK